MIMVINSRIAMKNKYTRLFFLIGILSLAFYACEDLADPIVEEVALSRVFAPTGLEARIRNKTTIELNWNVRAGAASYVVEFSEDSLAFTNIIRTVTVTPDELPLQEVFDGETRYSARVKAISAEEVEDSKWSAVTIMTELENIFLPIEDGDIAAVEATLRWPANSEVTHFIINPGSTQRDITTEEKASGVATVTGLTGETEYTVTLHKGTKQRGSIQFETLIDIGDATAVHPEDNLNTVITAAASGDVLVLFPGEYTVNSGATIVLNKSISIKGLYPYDKPKLHVAFSIENAGTAVELRDLDLDGDALLLDVLRYNTASVQYGALSMVGCTVHDFTRSLVAANATASKIASVTIDNCVMTDMLTVGGDFIDFRNTHVTNVTITNSTFDNCTPTRDFVRIDGVAPTAGFSGTGLTSTLLIDHCTLYGVSNNMTSTRRITYVRFNANVITVKNTIITGTTGYYTNQTASSQPICSNNNYFNAPRFYDAAFEVITGQKVDNSGTHTTVDPGFIDATNGNFTLSNQTLRDNQVGDPRWRQ
jgi:hypothetical protein